MREEENLVTPPQVRAATAILWVSFLIGTVFTVGRSAHSQDDIIWILLITTIFLFPFAFLVSAIHDGRNWARITYLIFAALSFVPFAQVIPILFSSSKLAAIVSCIQYLIQIIVVYLLFSKPGADWFKQPDRQ